MLRYSIAAAALCVLSLSAAIVPADARGSARRTSGLHPDCNVTMPCIDIRQSSFRTPQSAATAYQRAEWGSPLSKGETAQGFLAGLNSTLTAKLASLQIACPGTHLISGIRHTRIRRTGAWSLHASGNAMDVRGPYGCIYRQLKGWAGGYSTDAGAVNHIHISFDDRGGREMGLAFRHGGRRGSAVVRIARSRSVHGADIHSISLK